jgi:adenosylhomocysteine nucleosidase
LALRQADSSAKVRKITEKGGYMERGCIGLVAAMPQEIAPLLRRLKGYRREKVNGFNLYRAVLQGVPLVLVESGMGPKHASAATETLIAHASPGMILNFGFGGAVLPGIGIGDVVVAERVLLMEAGNLTEAPQPDADLSGLLLQSLSASNLPATSGTFITAAAIMNKKEVAGKVPAGLRHPTLEMETAAVLLTAQRAAVPVVALRGISDAADEELEFSLEEFCDANLNIRLPRVLACVARKPKIIPQLLRLSRNTKRAGNTLALAVEVALKALVQMV